jgi:putative transposase
MVEYEGKELPLCQQAELLGLSRSSLYYKPAKPTAEEVAIKHRIDEIYTRYPFYGSRRIRVQLNREGHQINRKRVQRYMREMAIEGVCPGPNLSRRNQEHKVYPYLLRGIKLDYPNQVWGIDITYIRLVGGWLYLVAILDWYSRYIISWELDQSLEMGFVMKAVDKGLSLGKPQIWNSDQGSHFTSQVYVSRLEENQIQISMDSKGRALDNIFTERLWRTIKYEDIYLKEYKSPRQAREGLKQYIEFYNEERPHSSLSYRTPAQVYSSH